MRITSESLRGLWRARCAERRTPGSGGGSGKPTDGNIAQDTLHVLRVLDPWDPGCGPSRRNQPEHFCRVRNLTYEQIVRPFRQGRRPALER